MFFQCNIKTDMSTLETWGSAMMDLRNRLVDFQTQTDKIVDLLSLRSAAANQSVLNGDIGSQSFGIGSSGSSASGQSGKNVAFPRDANREHDAVLSLDVSTLTEAELQRCHSLTLPKPDQMPTILLLPESNGLE